MNNSSSFGLFTLIPNTHRGYPRAQDHLVLKERLEQNLKSLIESWRWMWLVFLRTFCVLHPLFIAHFVEKGEGSEIGGVSSWGRQGRVRVQGGRAGQLGLGRRWRS